MISLLDTISDIFILDTFLVPVAFIDESSKGRKNHRPYLHFAESYAVYARARTGKVWEIASALMVGSTYPLALLPSFKSLSCIRLTRI